MMMMIKTFEFVFSWPVSVWKSLERFHQTLIPKNQDIIKENCPALKPDLDVAFIFRVLV